MGQKVPFRHRHLPADLLNVHYFLENLTGWSFEAYRSTAILLSKAFSNRSLFCFCLFGAVIASSSSFGIYKSLLDTVWIS